MTEIKICGLTRGEDVDAAVRAGAVMLGLVFAPQSPRMLGIGMAQRLAGRVPDEVQIVGVFMDQVETEVDKVIAGISLDVLQFHGRENNAFCKQFGLPFFKAVSMRECADVRAFAAGYPDAHALLLDSHGDGEAGGQGRVFDWSGINSEPGVPLILAGGLNPGNIRGAIKRVQPWAVDVSSGVEMAPGIKDHALMQEFCENVRNAADG